MSMYCCRYKCSCAVGGMIVSLVLGVIAAFLQITAVITITPVFCWVLFAVAIVLLGILVLSTAFQNEHRSCPDMCPILTLVLTGLLGTVLVAGILLLVGINATSVISAILVGLLVFFFALALTTLACYIRCSVNCAE